MLKDDLDRMQEALCASCMGESEPGSVTFRAMFGGRMAYVDGRPFASLSNVGLGLKLAPSDQVELLRIPGAVPLRYEPDAPPSKSYVVVPADWIDDPAPMEHWAACSVRHALSQPLKAKKPKA